MSLQAPLWIFGYGSLLWKQSHPSTETRACYIKGYTRRLWQGSPDHRGTKERPGRVATLLEAPGENCWGIAQRIPPKDIDATLNSLDIREQAGYERLSLPLYDTTGNIWSTGITYAASLTNPHYLGPAEAQDIATYALNCHGPSGSNVAYILNLATALREMNVLDPHIENIAKCIDEALARGEHA